VCCQGEIFIRRLDFSEPIILFNYYYNVNILSAGFSKYTDWGMNYLAGISPFAPPT